MAVDSSGWKSSAQPDVCILATCVPLLFHWLGPANMPRCNYNTEEQKNSGEYLYSQRYHATHLFDGGNNNIISLLFI
jgi:hypothetical protein